MDEKKHKVVINVEILIALMILGTIVAIIGFLSENNFLFYTGFGFHVNAWLVFSLGDFKYEVEEEPNK